MLFSTLFYNPDNPSKPFLVQSGFIYYYGYGYKYTDGVLSNLIKNWSKGIPQYYIPRVVKGGVYGVSNEDDYLGTQTKNRFPDIGTDFDNMTDTGNAGGVAGKGIILETILPE